MKRDDYVPEGENMNGFIHSTESFGSVDGPGVRFVIFVAGCPMRCQFCHNPDTWNMQVGEQKSADELLAQALRYRSYWKDGGGITVSGGEPLLQMDFMIELFQKAKDRHERRAFYEGRALLWKVQGAYEVHGSFAGGHQAYR